MGQPELIYSHGYQRQKWENCDCSWTSCSIWEFFQDSFASEDNDHNTDLEDVQCNTFTQQDRDNFIHPVTNDIILLALKRKKKNTPGPDAFPVEFFRDT